MGGDSPKRDDISFASLKLNQLKINHEKLAPSKAQPERKSEIPEIEQNLMECNEGKHHCSHHSDIIKFQDSKDEDFISEERALQNAALDEPSDAYGT